ncbi:MAG: hypothetical protein E6G47_00325 [Actinobacteria bacterium]|nr:MAG: hypothetical protein E6G47_00325 [Actinomycetota bacterium]
MTDEEEGRSTPPPRIVTPNPEAPTASEPATPYATVEKTASDKVAVGGSETLTSKTIDTPIVPASGSLDTEGSKPTPEGTAYKTDLGSGSYESKGPDLGGGLTAADVRAKVRERPVDEMLNDPLREVTRKERRSLLGISAIAMLVGWTHARVIPSKIENFGINFTLPDRSVLLWLFFWIVAYYIVAFVAYAATDALKYFHTMDEGAKTLRKQREEEAARSTSLSDATRSEAPWPLLRYVTLIITLVIAGVAMYSLWGAVHDVVPTVPSGPGTPGDYLKAVPSSQVATRVH